MNIDFTNLKTSYQLHKEEFDKAILRVTNNSNFIMGKEVGLLEKKLSEFTNTKQVISCSSGTDALILALMALEIQPGDEIITTPFTFIATAESIALLGAVPVFVDIDEKTFNIDPNKIEVKITKKTKAIIAVSLFGQVAEIDEINAIAKKNKLYVIEDAAQSFGATYKGSKSCSLTTVACTSFFPAKPLGCFGDGGAVFTNNYFLGEKVKSLREHGRTTKNIHTRIGLGARLDTLQAAILLVKLNYFNDYVVRRQKAANTYNRLINNNDLLTSIKEYNTSVWAQYPIRIKNRDLVKQKLMQKGIPTAIYYPKPAHLQACFRYLKYKQGDFPVSEIASKEILNLPINPFIQENEQEYIIEELKKII